MQFFPYKPDSKGSLADRARRCGLDEPALHLLNNTSMINPNEYVNTNIKELQTITEVEKGLIHIIAAEMSVEPDLLEFLRDLYDGWFCLIFVYSCIIILDDSKLYFVFKPKKLDKVRRKRQKPYQIKVVTLKTLLRKSQNLICTLTIIKGLTT